MFGKKAHRIRPLKHKEKKVHLKAECEKCGRFDVVSVYEDQVELPEFKLGFYECPQCRRTFCSLCASEPAAAECPFCKRLKPKKIKPFDIYLCGVCFREWWREGGLCRVCKFVGEKPAKGDGHYPGPTGD
ncbi:MAG: hypothetical protein V1875_01720 [Candidatus Altiarchaeota archaeon]